jgi:hypothetical protein
VVQLEGSLTGWGLGEGTVFWDPLLLR